MGILEKIFSGDISERLTNTTAEKNISCESKKADEKKLFRPTEPCPKNHQPPYGLHWWKDCYDNWHCTHCDPPASLSMVRDELLLGSDHVGQEPQGEATADQFELPGMTILAVYGPDGKPTFNPTIGSRERKEIVGHFDWFERFDLRTVTKKQDTPDSVTA